METKTAEEKLKRFIELSSPKYGSGDEYDNLKSELLQFRPAPLPDDAHEFFENKKITFTGVNAGDYLDDDDFYAYATALSSKLAEQEKEVNEANRQCLHAQQQGLKMLEKFNYWKQRCEAAEKVIHIFPIVGQYFNTSNREKEKAYENWKKLELNSEPNDERSVAREDPSSTDADKQKID